MTTPSNLPATRSHMSRMRRAFAPKLKPPIYDRRNCDTTSGYCACGAFHKIDALAFTHCVGCGRKLYTFKADGLRKCVNAECEHYGAFQ